MKWNWYTLFIKINTKTKCEKRETLTNNNSSITQNSTKHYGNGRKM